MSHGVAAIAFLAGLIGLGLAGCSGTAGVYNSGDEAANGSRSGVEATPEAHAGATPDQKWTHCTPGARSKDITAMKPDTNTSLTIGAFNGWDESWATAGLIKQVLKKDGYTVTIKGFDAGVGYQATAGGDIDIITDSWLPVTQAGYIRKYGPKLENLGCWYDNAKLTIAVNKNSPAHSIADLKKTGSAYGNVIYSIEPGAEMTKTIAHQTLPMYGLSNITLKTSSTPAMLAQLQKATKAGNNVAVTLWRPHWAYDAYPVRDLDDPKNAISNAELIYSFGRPGFEKDHPKAAQLIRNLAIDDAHLSSLEHLMVDTTKRGGQQDTAISRWMADNPDWVHDWLTGRLGPR